MFWQYPREMTERNTFGQVSGDRMTSEQGRAVAPLLAPSQAQERRNLVG